MMWTQEGDQFLVVWEGNTAAMDPTNLDREIWSRSIRFDAQGLVGDLSIRSGAQGEVGPLIPISDMGGGALTPEAYDASDSVIAVGEAGRFLVAWSGDDDEDGQVDDEVEIFGELVRGNWIFVDGFESGTVGAWSP